MATKRKATSKTSTKRKGTKKRIVKAPAKQPNWIVRKLRKLLGC